MTDLIPYLVIIKKVSARSSEEVEPNTTLGSVTNGAYDDIKKATEPLAKTM